MIDTQSKVEIGKVSTKRCDFSLLSADDPIYASEFIRIRLTADIPHPLPDEFIV